jgi:uncharacterized protein (DUF1778 family)
MDFKIDDGTETIIVSAEDWDHLWRILEGPPKDMPKLRATLAKAAPWDNPPDLGADSEATP